MAVVIELGGQVALVTGASRGIGRAIAERLAEAGARLVLCARSAEPLARLAHQLGERYGVEALAVPGDVGAPEFATTAVKQALERFGRLDVLVNNAGLTADGLLVRMAPEQWQQVLEVNLSGAYRFVRAALRPMMRQQSGRIVNITSVVGLRGNAGQANYAASKAGLIGLTKSVAREVGARGITCNAVAPGLIETDMAAQLDEAQRRRFLEQVPLGALGQPAQVADAVLFLVSPLAAYLTGVVLCVDGGFAM
ncbi:MAG: beta-ketoacyl-ACP reductase [Planctomycetota bacterium]|nr:MAG: beta-ketoacyl-ACP reductase [Planctomycetota bacterium]